MRITLEKGFVDIYKEVFSVICGCAAVNCFGVKGMSVRNTRDGIVQLLKREVMSRGINIIDCGDGDIAVELHIVVEYGVNILSACRSIITEVAYNVSRLTGVNVSTVDIYVDSILSE